MINLAQAPTSGRVLAYAVDRLVYDGYELKDGAIIGRAGSSLDLEGIYELHLYDAETEFRAELVDGAWKTSVMRAADEVDDDDHFTFSESQFIRARYWVDVPNEHVVVNNRFSFSEDGFLRLDGYRLAMEVAQ